VSAKARADGRPAPGVSGDLLEKLRAYDWPNNVRELHQTIANAVAEFKGEVLGADDVELGG
jgi:DNA-binding NtrC family response regulator